MFLRWRFLCFVELNLAWEELVPVVLPRRRYLIMHMGLKSWDMVIVNLCAYGWFFSHNIFSVYPRFHVNSFWYSSISFKYMVVMFSVYGALVASELAILLFGLLISSPIKILRHCVRVMAHNLALLIQKPLPFF